MRLLLDTHAFLWTISEVSRLPPLARRTIEDKSNQVFVSAVSLWEISIKVRIGKLRLGWDDDLVTAATNAGIETLPLTPEEAASYGDLAEPSHKDPFDRMLIWQAINRKLVLVSGDSTFKRFESDGLALLWD
ncbi:MAG: type II toxin-antitoxin system VapC family toxin [Pyrinomonadaceae bacterium]|nr:type II toxin-antitoxin system VapC family toxin [Pyrinomonadaceae bacterium]MBP6211638.1 type II toxin-antitoxin system VapC family toxin [Pyrinomonadaceae bacterium]